MNEYLLEREKDELLKPERRSIEFPDGKTRRVSMSNLHWRWFDRLVAYPFGKGYVYERQEVLDGAARDDNIQNGWTIDTLLAYVIERDVKSAEEQGVDITETLTDIDLMMAKKATMKFHNRNPKIKKS